MNLRQKITKFGRLILGFASRYPQEIQLEITNRCNFSCTMCPRKVIQAPWKDMSWSTFKKVIDSLQNPQNIILTGWGEPLLHKDFLSMIEYINRKLPQAKIKFTTNGSLLNQKLSNQLLKRNIYEISFSIDTIDQNSAGHRHDHQILENIETLIRSRGGRKLPRICFQTVITEKYREIESVIEFASKNNVDKINLIRLFRIFNPELSRPAFAQEQKIIKQARNLAQSLGLESFSLNTFNPFRYLATHFDQNCLRTDNYLYITVDGQVAPCCNLRNTIYGSIQKQDLNLIWHNQKFKSFRRNQKKLCGLCDGISWRQK